MTTDRLRALLGRRLLNMGARVHCGDDINTAEVIASGRVFALIELPQVDEGFDPLESASMAVDERGNMRAIILTRRSEVDNGRYEAPSSEEENSDKGS